MKKLPGKQQGMVLMVGLILLISLTLMGVMGVKMTTLDERIAANNQFRTLVFHGAESVLSEMSEISTLLNAEACGSDVEGRRCIERQYSTMRANDEGALESAPLEVTAKATIISEREVDLPGSSIGESGGAVLRMRLYDIEAEATLSQTNAKAVHRAGIGRIVPLGD